LPTARPDFPIGRAFAWLLCFAATCAAFPARSQPLEREAWASLGQRRLVERAGGGVLLTEQGPMARAGLRLVRNWASGAAVAIEGSFGVAQLDYDGQTSLTAIPLSTITRQHETEVDLLFSPDRHWRGGELWLSLGLLDNRRIIRATALTRELYERSDAVMAGIRWRSPGFGTVAGWTLRAEADARLSLHHRLHVNFYGLLSPSRLSLDGGDKQLLRLRLRGSAEHSPWEWAVEWSRLSQGVSSSARATGFGMALTVSQPELTIRDVSLRLTRRF